MKMRQFALVFVTGLALAACGRDNMGAGGSGGAGGSAGTGGTAGTGGSGGGMVTTIKELRQHPPGIGSSVTLNDVVVVQEVDSSKYGDIWVQDRGGGPYSGVHLFCNYGGTSPNCSMDRTAVQGFRRGKVVNVMGVYNPFTPNTPVGAPTLIEINKPVITDTGMTATPTAADVTAEQVAKDVTSANSAAYQGVYVRVTSGPFMVSSLTPLEFQGTCPINDAGATAYFGVEATAGAQTLAVSLNFHCTTPNPTSLSWYLAGCFSPPTACPQNNVLTNQSFTTVSGIVEPDYTTSVPSYLAVMPTVDEDLPISH